MGLMDQFRNPKYWDLMAIRWAEAEAVARQALTKLEGSGELYEAYAYYNLGRALVEQGRCDEALPHLEVGADPGSRKEIRAQPEGGVPGPAAPAESADER